MKKQIVDSTGASRQSFNSQITARGKIPWTPDQNKAAAEAPLGQVTGWKFPLSPQFL